MISGFVASTEATHNRWYQANALIAPFNSIRVLGKRPQTRLL
jgi:hypothetical protein